MIELNNGIIAFSFDERTGSLTQIKDLTTGRECFNDSRGNRLLRLILSNESRTSIIADASRSPVPRMTKKSDTLAIEFPEILDEDGNNTGISAFISVRLPAGSPEAFFNLELRNTGSYFVHEAQFPWIGGWNGFAGKGKDMMTLGLAKRDPHHFPGNRGHGFGRHNQRWFSDFTAVANAPFFDLLGVAGIVPCIDLALRVPHA